MPAQAITITAKQKFSIGPFEEFAQDGADLGLDTEAMTLVSSDTTILTVTGPDANGIFTAAGVAAGTATISINDATTGTGSIVVTVNPEVDTTIVATLGTPVLQ